MVFTMLASATLIGSILGGPFASSAPSILQQVDAKLLGYYFAVEGAVNGKPAKFIVDTGAGACVLTPEAAKRFALPKGQAITANGVGEKPVQAYLTTADSIAMGQAESKNVMIAVIDLPPALQCDGLIGYTFLKNFAVTLDYQKPGLTLFKPGDYKPGTGQVEGELRVRGNIPNFKGALGGVEGWFALDSGAGGTLTVMTPFVESQKLREKIPNRVERIVGKGVGGFVKGESVRLDGVSFAGIQLPKMPASLSANKSGAFATSEVIGNVGGELLRRFVVTLDYPGSKVYFRKSPAFDDAFNEDRSGMFVDFTESAATVVDVVPNGPAYRAGIRVGDVVRLVDGAELIKLHPLEASKIFRSAAGSKINLVVQRKTETLNIELVLGDILE